ncbi:hypothetical protein ABZ016_20055 [Streptomyces sp. NPDC006372]|uniref:hypothetical protein n=1 Tax=Streptomyces sp. NPDC006372 TaxID=3155599 RepID=UPI0033BA45AC
MWGTLPRTDGHRDPYARELTDLRSRLTAADPHPSPPAVSAERGNTSMTLAQHDPPQVVLTDQS